MGRSGYFFVLLLSIPACTVTPSPRQPFLIVQPSAVEEITAVSFDHEGRSLWVSRRSGDGCQLDRFTVEDRTMSEVRRLSFCPDRIDVTADGIMLATSPNGSLLIDVLGSELMSGDHVLSAASRDNFITEEGGRLQWHRRGQSIALGSSLRSPRILPRSDTVIAVQSSKIGESLVRISESRVQSLTDEFRLIDSFDVSPDEKEFVISADGGKGFDAGLLSAEGGEIGWIFPDPLPEREVTWAPRGNKISYVVETLGGALVRTVHVPTSFQLTVDFPLSAVIAMSWEPKAEKFAAVISSPNRGPRIELLRYNGEDREILWTSQSALRGEIDRMGDAVLLSPPVIRYGEKYPVVVWVSAQNPLGWSSLRASVHNGGEVGTVVAAGPLDARLWSSLEALPWVDKDRVFVVYSEAAPTAVRHQFNTE